MSWHLVGDIRQKKRPGNASVLSYRPTCHLNSFNGFENDATVGVLLFMCQLKQGAIWPCWRFFWIYFPWHFNTNCRPRLKLNFSPFPPRFYGQFNSTILFQWVAYLFLHLEENSKSRSLCLKTTILISTTITILSLTLDLHTKSSMDWAKTKFWMK